MNPRFVEWWLAHPSLFGMPFHFWTIIIAILGSFVGSFLNVCIHRMPLNQSVVNPPSHCPHCRYSIPWYLNIPVITWIWLLGKCRSCRAPISPRYLAVEVLTGAVFVVCWLTFGHNDPATALALCVPGDLLLIFGDSISRCWKQIVRFREQTHPGPARGNPQSRVGGLAMDPAPVAAPANSAPHVAAPVATTVAPLTIESGFVEDTRGVRLPRPQEAED